MGRLVLEVDTQLYASLQRAARAGNLSLEQECLRRLEESECHSRYIQALVSELRADEEQRRASDGIT
ncbi:hypothetical protein GCM10009504_42210 [Pseudomonas laurentiana]|uniref:CopG family transcriptional regulator n=1 Tax=Pseudomonas laurentiana TaxID=2364649 RepID=A0A6I5RLR6_9PSED|nr:hypothetical protein [Pseudomonas laurentiana]NES08720.1 hypothetical protein [Pseudomonas laurentiana]GGU81016.1 hypothetical protein GCM10009504_42210 [Pseudomonas laurentiana]